MKIRKSTFNDLNAILELYRKARVFMSENGNPSQWGSSYPSTELVEQDIAEGSSYVCESDGRIAAVFYYKFGKDATYQTIRSGSWLNDLPYGVVHRITSDGTVKGAATYCLNWAFQQCRNLKIDTHRENLIMQHLLKKNGFSQCGIIYTDDGTERLAYQKE
mgnify:CR=1 FL=1